MRLIISGSSWSLRIQKLTVNQNQQDKMLVPSFLGVLLYSDWGWSGGAMMLGKLPLSGHLTILENSRQGPTALTVGAEFVWTFSHVSFLSSFSLSLGDCPI